MLCYVMLCYVMLCYHTLHSTILYHRRRALGRAAAGARPRERRFFRELPI